MDPLWITEDLDSDSTHSFEFSIQGLVHDKIVNCLTFLLHRLTEKMELEGTLKEHWVQLLGPHNTIPKSHTMCSGVLHENSCPFH